MTTAREPSGIEIMRLVDSCFEERKGRATQPGDIDIFTDVAARAFDVAPADVTREQRSLCKQLGFRRLYSTPLPVFKSNNFLAQAIGAEQQMNLLRQRLLAAGFQETMTDCWEHPEGGGYPVPPDIALCELGDVQIGAPIPSPEETRAAFDLKLATEHAEQRWSRVTNRWSKKGSHGSL